MHQHCATALLDRIHPGFEALIASVLELGEETSYIATTSIEDGAAAEILMNGEHFLLVHLRGDEVVAYCELGAISLDQSSLRCLLEWNIELAATGRGGLAIEPGTDRAVFVMTLRLSTLPVETLRALRMVAERVRGWREELSAPLTTRS